MSAKHLALGFAIVLGVSIGALGCGSSDGTLIGQPGAYSGHPGSGGGPGGSDPHQGGNGAGVGNPGGGGTTPTNMSAAEAYFVSTVYPAFSTSPGNDASGSPILPCTTCHATGAYGAPTFLSGADAPSAYTSLSSSSFSGLIAIPANSLIILHGQHTGPALTPAEIAIVTQWLTLEAQERNLPTAPTKTLLGELTKIGKCMSLTDFTAKTANGTAAASIYQSTARYQGNDVQCQRCHSDGNGGFYANQTASTMLTMTQGDLAYVKKYFTGTVDTNGQFQSLIASGSISQKVDLTKTCYNQAACHPPIQLNTGANESDVLKAIDTFVSTTLSNYNAGKCP